MAFFLTLPIALGQNTEETTSVKNTVSLYLCKFSRSPLCTLAGLWAAFNLVDYDHFLEIHFVIISAIRQVLPTHWLLLSKIICQLVIFCLTSKCWSVSWVLSLSPLHCLLTLHPWPPSLVSSVTTHVKEPQISLCSPVFSSAQDVYIQLAAWHLHMHDQQAPKTDPVESRMLTLLPLCTRSFFSLFYHSKPYHSIASWPSQKTWHTSNSSADLIDYTSKVYIQSIHCFQSLLRSPRENHPYFSLGLLL